MTDAELIDRFGKSLEDARRNGSAVRVARGRLDFDEYRWRDGTWQCDASSRPSGDGFALSVRTG